MPPSVATWRGSGLARFEADIVSPLLLCGVPLPPRPRPSPSPRIRSPTVRDVPALEPDPLPLPLPDPGSSPPARAARTPRPPEPLALPAPLSARALGLRCCSDMCGGSDMLAGGAEFLRRIRARDERVVRRARA